MAARVRTGGASARRPAYASTSRHRHGYHSASHRRYGYRGAGTVRLARPAGRHDCHSWYRSHGIRLSFQFGFGSYLGVRYYYPYYHYLSGCHYAFFDPGCVTYAYVPYGFFCDAPAVYINRTYVVREEYPVETYEVVAEDGPAADVAADATEVDPEPAAGSPLAERLLREATEAFRAADYRTAARKFRLAAIAAPDTAGPLFALGQALLALGEDDAYAARVVRMAVLLEPSLVHEPGDISGVYKDQAEFERILDGLGERARLDADARFLLAVERYLTGDPRAAADFAVLSRDDGGDEAVALFRAASAKRFKAADELPPIGK